MTESIVINEVGLRDGLQSQPKHLTLYERERLANALLATGLRHFEVGSFVSPKAVPRWRAQGICLPAFRPHRTCTSVH